MTECTVNVRSGLDPRLTAMFVQTASKFNSHISVKIENKSANAKSIMGIMSLSVSDGQQLELIADGADEEQALAELERFLSTGTNE